MSQPTDKTIQTTLLLLVGQMFFLAYAFSLLNITAYSLFLTFFESESLAYVFIAIAIFVSLVSYGYIQLQGRWALSRLAAATIFSFAFIYFAAWFLLLTTQAGWLAFALMVAVTLLELLGMILIGNQAGRLFDVRQMKRFYPTVVSGMLAGYMIGGATTTLLVRLLGSTENLLLVCGASTLITLGLLSITIRRFPEAYQAAETTSSADKPKKSLRQLLDKKYVRAVFSYQMLSAIGTQLVIFLYFTLADARYDSAEELAQFFGILTIVREVVSLAFTGLVAGRLLNRFGMGFGLTANPIIVGAMILVMAVLGLSLGWSFAGFFWLAVAAYILDVMLSDGTTSTSVKTSYQALPANEQTMVETTVEGIGVPVAYGFTGILLLVLSLLPTQSLLPFMIMAVIISVLWAMMAFAVYRDYAGTLVKTLSRRALNTVALSLDDSASLQIIERLLASDKVGEVRLALDVLEGGEREILSTHLLALAKHKTAVIRREALQRLEKHQIDAGLPIIEDILATDNDPQVRGTAVRTLCALAEDDLVETVQPFLDDGTSATSVGAIVGLLRYGGISGVLAAGQQLTEWQASPDDEERRVAAEAIGEVSVANFYRPLIPLLQDDAASVRREALVASSKVHHPRLLPYVIDNLANPLTRSAAMSALTATGDRLLPIASRALANETEHDEEDIIRMVRVCGQMKGQPVIDTLKPHIDHPDNDVQLAVLQALQLADYHAAVEAEIAEINRTLRGEVAHSLRVLLTKQDLGKADVYDAVHRALDHEYEEARQRTFLLLSFIYDTRAILRAEEQLILGNSASQALALETLDVTLTGEQKQMVFPLVDAKLAPEQRIKQLQAIFELDHSSTNDRLAEIIADPEQEWTNGWTRACVLQAVGKLGLTELVQVVEDALRIEEHPVQETAVWTLYTLSPQHFKTHQDRLKLDDNPNVAKLAMSLAK